MELHWSKEEACWFHLYSVGLQGHSYPAGEEGIRRCFADLDVLQLDPLPVLGRSHDLVIQARIDGMHPGQVLELIHRQRLGFEYWDKMLSLIPISYYPWFRPWMATGGDSWEREREQKLKEENPDALDAVYTAIESHGPLSSRELKGLEVAQEAHRGWKATRIANVALESLWNRGKISVSHRVNFRRYFDLTERVVPAHIQEIHSPSLDEFWPYLLQKRVRNAGLLPLRGNADSWASLRQVRRSGLPEEQVEADRLALVRVEGIRTPFLAPADAAEQLGKARGESFDRRARFLSPLDPLLWGRNSLKKLWDFEYAWLVPVLRVEVYKPPAKRRWGYYVLPVLYGDRFVARFACARPSGNGRYDSAEQTLQVLSYHEELDGLPWSHPLVMSAFEQFLIYLGGERIAFPDGEVLEGTHSSGTL